MGERRQNKKGCGLLLALIAGLFLPALLPAAEETGTLTGTVKAAGSAVVYIERVEGNSSSPNEPVVMNQINKTYIPHLLPVLIGTTVRFKNNDDLLHNILARHKGRTIFNFGMPSKEITVDKTLDKRREGVVTLLCNVHPEMSAYVLVLQNPFFAVTNEAGEYTIPNVPPGNYVLKAWHERLKPQSQEVQVTAGGITKADFALRP